MEQKKRPMLCKSCSRQLNPEDDFIFIVNSGIPGKEYVECELCHTDSLENHRIIMCEGCGGYFSQDILAEEEFCGESFCACPSCGKDIVEGLTREEFEREYGSEPAVEVKGDVSLASNNQRQIVLEQARSDGAIAVTVWGAPTKDGIKPRETEYSISPGDFVSMLNWYRYQKNHGNKNLMF